MHVKTANTLGNSHIGLYAYATDEYCVLGPQASSLKEDIEQILQVKVIVTTIAGTSLAGVFLAGNTNKLLVPGIIFENEIASLEKAGIEVEVLETRHTALGNNIVANDEGCLASPEFSSAEINQIKQALKVPVHQCAVGGVEVVGSSIIANKKGALIHRDATSLEQNLVKDTLKVPRVTTGSVNFGMALVRAGLIANNKGFLIGTASGGPEITNADEALGFLEI